MGKSERRAYRDAIVRRYRRANKSGKSAILDEFCAVCGYHRKYALRLLRAPQRTPRPRKPGPVSRYAHPQLLAALRAIWLACDQPCSRRLKAALPLWLPHYVQRQALTPATLAQLHAISAATIDRKLKPVRAKAGRKGLCGTKPGTLLKKQIPIQAGTWEVTQPRFVEADTVAHCGESLAGSFVWSLTMTDICTAWTECRATWNKGSEGVIARIRDIEQALPFALRGFDCDNDSEFLNWHLLREFGERPAPVKFTRSRPYHSNDNAHVEQKNWSCVRQLFGYDRFDRPALVAAMNDLYAHEFSLLNNYFTPNMKLQSKARLGSKWVKKHAAAQTPAQRVLAHPDIPEATKQRIRQQLDALNPFDLQKKSQHKLRQIFHSLGNLRS